MRCQRRDHRWAQRMSDIGHDRIDAAAFDKGAQLVLEILRLLARQPRHREVSTIALARQAMAGLAIVKLGLKFIRPTHDRKTDRQGYCQDRGSQPCI